MKKILPFVLGLLFACNCASAGINNSYMVHHASWWNNKAPDNLSNVLMEVTPKGLYAEVQLTFTMKGNSILTGPSDSLQGVLNFELPPNSFIHDSWLWLNDSVIIRAAIQERTKAIQVYSGYIQRRQDPSLLLKTGTNMYQLNVFPVTNNYPRKVKITFSTLMTQLNGKAMLTLPTDLLTASQIKPDYLAIIHSSGSYTQPSFAETNYNSLIVNSFAGSDLLSVSSALYTGGKELNLIYQTSADAAITIFPTGNSEGVYELKIPAETTTTTPRCLNFILDHRASSNYYYSYDTLYRFEEIKKRLRSFMLTNCRPTDSFNIFYVNNNTVVQVSAGWMPMDATTIHSVLNNIPDVISSEQGKFTDLLLAGITYGQSKPPVDEHTIIISQNTDYTSLQSATTVFNAVTAAVGNYTNKISVINYVAPKYSSVNGSEILFNNFCAASGGSYYKYTGRFFDGFLSRYTYDLDIRSILKGILYYMADGHNSYNVNLPISSGFTYNTYNLSGEIKHFNWLPYCETGKYYGNMTPGFATISYISQGTPVVHSMMVNAIDSGNRHHMRSWVNNYLLELESMNNAQLYSEILDSSIANRVLCYETAFLALENGDTIGDEDDTMSVALNIEETKQVTVSKIKCFPNPFSNTLTIESPDEIETIEIFDITGRLIFSVKEVGSKTFVWNGLNSSGTSLSPGVYIIKLQHKGKVETIKVSKL